jgi:uncharacterized coiled-coil DUF342 family protein
MDQLQGNQVDLTLHIKEGKEQQHVIQTQVLELASNITEMNNNLTEVANGATTAKHKVEQLNVVIQNLTTKQETAVMYAEIKETTDEIKSLLKQLVGNPAPLPPSNTPMISTDTTFGHKAQRYRTTRRYDR